MSRDFTTKPRPDQPGRCPSIDPHDTLQCTRAIHDDDQCQAGGIAWRKGSPRIEWDRERADRLQKDVEEYDAILTRQSDLLTRTVNALRGNPPPLTSWSHHDIPELAAEKVAEVARLTAEREWFKDRFPCDGVCVDAPEEACSRHGRNPADLWRIIGEVTAGRDAQTKRAERLERWYADALTMLDKSRRWKSIASLTAERDSLAARLALVEALAEAEVERLTAERDALAAAHARESEKVWKVEEVMDDIEGSDPTTWERLRDALSGSGADTSDTQTTDQEVSDE